MNKNYLASYHACNCTSPMPAAYNGKGKGKGHPCTGTEALYKPYGLWGE